MTVGRNKKGRMSRVARDDSYDIWRLGRTILLLSWGVVSINGQSLIHTNSGYDTLSGVDPICWVGQAEEQQQQPPKSNTEGGSISLLNPDFVAGSIDRWNDCFVGTQLNVKAPPEHLIGSGILHSLMEYSFHVTGTLNLTALSQELSSRYNTTATQTQTQTQTQTEPVWELTPPQIAIRLLFCEATGHFCSPFSLDQIAELSSNPTTNDEPIDDHGQDHHEEKHDAETLVTPVTLLDVNSSSTMIDFDIAVLATMLHEGLFIPLGIIELFVQNDDNNNNVSSSTMRVDIANMLTERVLEFQKPPAIQLVSQGLEIVVYFMIGVGAAIQLGMLLCLVKYRNESVVQLSQGGFLALCLIAGIIATVSSVLFNATTDLHCQLRAPLVLIPCQFLLAIVIGRIRRILHLMSPVVNWGHTASRNQRKSSRYLARMLPDFAAKSSMDDTTSSQQTPDSTTEDDANNSTTPSEGNNNNSNHRSSWSIRNSLKCAGQVIGSHTRPSSSSTRAKSIRAEFSVLRLWMWIVGVTLPQVVLEIGGEIFFPTSLTLELNDDETVGRYQCESHAYHYLAYAILLATLLFLLIISQQSRSLPSLFNEADAIASSIQMVFFVNIIAVAIVILSRDPAVNPGIQYFVLVMTILCLTVSLTFRLIYPKLALIWSGEKVVVSQLLKDHKISTTSAASSHTNKSKTTTTLPYATSNGGPSNNSNNSTTDIAAMRARVSQAASSNTDKQQQQQQQHSNSSQQVEETNIGVEKKMEPMEVEGHTLSSSFAKHDSTKSVRFQHGHTVSNEHHGTTAGGGGDEEEGEHSTLPLLVIRESAAPPRKVTGRLLELVDIASHVKTRILSGLQVKQNDWEDLRTSVAHMDKTFRERVHFDWEDSTETAS